MTMPGTDMVFGLETTPERCSNESGGTSGTMKRRSLSTYSNSIISLVFTLLFI